MKKLCALTIVLMLDALILCPAQAQTATTLGIPPEQVHGLRSSTFLSGY